LIIESKSNYDRIHLDSEKTAILEALKADDFCSQTSLGNLINVLLDPACEKLYSRGLCGI